MDKKLKQNPPKGRRKKITTGELLLAYVMTLPDSAIPKPPKSQSIWIDLPKK
jgi:hypothetical protein